MIFRALNSDQERSFRQWARDNYDPSQAPDVCWHPVVQDEWRILTDAAETVRGA